MKPFVFFVKSNRQKEYRTNKLYGWRIFLVFFLTIIASSFSFHYVSLNLYPNLLLFANADVERVTATIINNININNFMLDDIIHVDSDNNIVTAIQFDAAKINQLTNKVVNVVQYNVIASQNNDSTYYVPLGVAFNSALLANLGPRIPIKYELIGRVRAQPQTRISEAGINNVLIEVVLIVNVKQRTILPLASNEIELIQEIPLAIKYVVGKVPDFYMGNHNLTSNGLLLPSD